MSIFTEKREVSGALSSAEVRYKHKDGSWRTFDVVGHNLLDDLAVVGIVINSRDMARNLICESLTERGYTVIEAQTPPDGLQLATETKEVLHLLLTDVIMPDTNGRELYENVVAIHPAIKVLYISGYTDNVIIHHGILDEGTNFLQKPFTVHNLTQKVRQVLD